MKTPPVRIGGATVVAYTVIDVRHRATGRTKHFVAESQAEPAAGLAICQYENDGAFYLFGCDADWNGLTDTWHETIDDAKRQAESEYLGTAQTWLSLTA